jgi:ABC-2 type transport system ATP-binding protein
MNSHTEPTSAISISNVTKTYAARGNSPAKLALDNISLNIPRGSMFALLGPNGAGKSTLINIMAGLVVKSSGTVTIWDTDIDKNPRQAKSNIGIVPQEINFDPFFTPERLLDLHAGMYGVPKAERRTKELLELVGLLDKANAYTRALSGGMKRRLMVAKAMVHTPPILVLDEPTAGVDVELRRQLWDNVRELNAGGMTVLLTTHYLEEAEELCDRIAIINGGKIVANDLKENLLSDAKGKEILVTIDRAIDHVPHALEIFGATLRAPNVISLCYAPKETHMGQVIEAITLRAGLGIIDIMPQTRDLEDVFLELTR